jgi:hypothetical protein
LGKALGILELGTGVGVGEQHLVFFEGVLVLSTRDHTNVVTVFGKIGFSVEECGGNKTARLREGTLLWTTEGKSINLEIGIGDGYCEHLNLSFESRAVSNTDV